MIGFDSASRSRFLAIIGSFAFIPGAPAQEKGNPSPKELPTLSSLKLEFDVRRAEANKPIAEFQAKYEEQLKKLQAEMTKLGDLERVVAVKAEVEGYKAGDTTPAEPSFPELARLQEIYAETVGDYERTRDEKLAALIDPHKVNLLALQKRLTQEEKLEEALKVNAALKETEQLRSEIGVSGTPSTSTLAKATREKPFENSFGMKFVPVPIHGGPTGGKFVLFSIWETRVREYQKFVKKTGRQWRSPFFKQGDDHPAVWVPPTDAQEFCDWLTEEERKKKSIGTADRYRLPSDHEWSCAMGIARREDPDQLPLEKSGKIEGLHPWGKEWPPPNKVGNYLGEETLGNLVSGRDPIPGFEDGYRETAPVGTFVPNEFGLFDMGGNVSEWVADWSDPIKKERRIFRDAGWRHQFSAQLNSSARQAGARFDHIGFRCVLEADAEK